ncbi:uncharacterized protein LOC123524998 [Mercenaria mercenaria]|uniref:uncharacterized protein LOC123524998 n=1 Tax=Mercenaria mercenaria TaxID=6596 RepID=UPI001E1E12ED|nr:uncharacterized protein LOC123524998 [Mercenaria mercenaria]
MPVYVTRAHVTIGDAFKKEKRKGPIVPRHVFQVSDIRRTPYCFSTFFVTVLGFAIVSGGVIMTIIGYKPSILLPWYHSINQTSQVNETNPSAIPSVLGEPGPLRVLVYFGPILMGIGVFSMMVAIVLFCEIKDRYFNNILPKYLPGQQKRDKMYDKIIEEFRKNYFRGIEVPLRPPRKRSKSRFSISLSRSGSIASFGRRLSHDFQKRFRKSSRESQNDKPPTKAKPKRSTIRKHLEDTWMKTSSLPNIRHKDSIHSIYYDIESSACPSPARTSKSCGPTLEKLQIVKDANGVDNPAYRNSPPDKSARTRPLLTKHASLDTSDRNKHVTTVIVHRETNNESDDTSFIVHHEPNNETENNLLKTSYLPELTTSRDRSLNHSIYNESFDSEIDIDRDIQIIPTYNEVNETNECIPLSQERPECLPMTNMDNSQNNAICTCGTDIFCAEHASLGMDSGGSSLSLSWDNIPSEWNDSRRNTEPVVFYRRSFNNQTDTCLSDNIDILHKPTSSVSEMQRRAHVFEDVEQKDESNESLDQIRGSERKGIKTGHFKTRIGIFKSDSNLLRVGTYSLLRSQQQDNISLDSLSLTEDMLKNFEMAETGYI